MKLTGTIYDFGDESPQHHLRAIGDEIGERLAINNADDSDDEAARGQELRSFLYAIADALPTPNEEIAPLPLHVALHEIARRPTMSDNLRRILQDLARDCRTEYDTIAQRLDGYAIALALLPAGTCEQYREDFAALLNRAKNALQAERFDACESYLAALNALDAEARQWK